MDLTKYAGAGTQDLPKSASLPFVEIVQKGSPEFDESHKDYEKKKVEGCKPGDLILDGNIIKRPLNVIPLAVTSLYSEWKPNKGGFVANHEINIIDNKAYHKGIPGTNTEYKEYLGDNELVFTHIYAVLAYIENKWAKVLIKFTSTELKESRSWSRLIKSAKHPSFRTGEAPIFANGYVMITGPKNNAKGSWMGFTITRATDPAITDEALLKDVVEAFEGAQKALPRAGQQAAIAAPGASGGPDEDQPF